MEEEGQTQNNDLLTESETDNNNNNKMMPNGEDNTEDDLVQMRESSDNSSNDTDSNCSDNNVPSPATPHPLPQQEPQQEREDHLLQTHSLSSDIISSTTTTTPMTDNALTEDNKILREKACTQSEKIMELENTITLYKKRLEQSEELLYELQWDPSHDLMACRENGDTKTVEELQEKKIFQLLEQMRVMENGLHKKQIQIDALSNEIRLLRCSRAIGSNPTSPSLEYSNTTSSPSGPRLQSIIVGSYSPPTNLSPLSPTPLTAQSLPNPSSLPNKAPPVPQVGWFSYFMGARRDKGRKIVNI